MAKTGSHHLSLQDVRDRVTDTLVDAYQSNDFCIVDALPASGKTYSTFKAAASTDTPLLYLAPRKDLYIQAEKHCQSFGLSYHRLPSPFTGCPSFSGAHGESLSEELQGLYSRGLSGVEIHDLHEGLPCQDNGCCDYIRSLNFDPAEYQVLIGNPKHAYNTQYLDDRVVVHDEFSETEFETRFDNLRPIINKFVRNVGLPFGSYQEILAPRSNLSDTKHNKVVRWFDKYGLYRDRTGVLTAQNTSYHALAPALTYALLYGFIEDLDNGWERTILGVCAEVDNLKVHGLSNQTVFVRDQQADTAYLLRPPEFDKADGFIGLDGTPTVRMWETSTGLDLTHREVLSIAEKKYYISNILDHTIIQTNSSKKPYQNGRNVTPPKDTSLAFWISLQEGNKPNVITSKKAIKTVYPAYQGGEFFNYVGQTMNFAQVRSSNAFGNEHLGLVIGSRHYGDEFIQKWGAYLGKGISPSSGPQHWSRSYGHVGNLIRDHLYNETLQDVLRFGRDQQPTTVYVNTSALPSWVPTKKETDFPVLGKNRRNVIRVLKRRDNRGASVAELADKTRLSKEGALKAGKYLVREGLASYEELEGYSNVFVWD